MAVRIDKEFPDTVLKSLITQADMAIGARYHFCVFAASELVPFLGMASGIYERTKLEGLANLCKMPECHFPQDMQKSSISDVWPYVEALVGNLGNHKL